MIGHLEGDVIGVRAGYAIVSAQGVGYKVYATRETLRGASEGSRIAVWTHLAVREDALDLYGFAEEADLNFFELLLMVSGIGPKSALAILDIAEVETLRSAIAQGNDSYLTKVSGIGKKTAAKIILELREKVGAGSVEAARVLEGEEDALEAMRSLGYSLQESRDALRKVPASITSTNDRLREALKLLGSNSK